MAKLERFNARRRDWGLKRALHWELMNALSRLGIHVHYVRAGGELKRPGEGELPIVPEGYETRMVGLEDLLPFANRVPGLDEEFLRNAFARGDECAANFYHGDLVGFGFASRTRARATAQLDVLIPEGFHYYYKDWTLDAHRGKHLTLMRGHARFDAQRSGLQARSIWYVETHNYLSALHAYVHPRERPLSMGLCGWFTLFGRQIPFNTRRAKWLGFEMVRKEDHRRRLYVT